VKHKLADKIVEMKNDRSLFARLMIVARSHPELNLKRPVGSMSSLLFHELCSLLRESFYLA